MQSNYSSFVITYPAVINTIIIKFKIQMSFTAGIAGRCLAQLKGSSVSAANIRLNNAL